ncbi:MAG: hypothetical protein FWC00_04770 [Firmicutes bacterium]|nr:hypothetical protein [Bacillota bacterium]
MSHNPPPISRNVGNSEKTIAFAKLGEEKFIRGVHGHHLFEKYRDGQLTAEEQAKLDASLAAHKPYLDKVKDIARDVQQTRGVGR